VEPVGEGASTLRWSFGQSPESIRVGFTLALARGAAGAGAAADAPPEPRGWRRLGVSFAGMECTGAVREDGMVLTLTLLSPALATVVYRMIDDDSECAAAGCGGGGGGGGGLRGPGGSLVCAHSPMCPPAAVAVSITEVPERGVATVQQGFMFRVA
jgi:hypothetical protein